MTAVIVPRAGAPLRRRDGRSRQGAQGFPLCARECGNIVDAIPVSPLGKPDKKAIRARYWAGSDRLVH